jgi:hypothetical protein
MADYQIPSTIDDEAIVEEISCFDKYEIVYNKNNTNNISKHESLQNK